jgi:hypothetical protein
MRMATIGIMAAGLALAGPSGPALTQSTTPQSGGAVAVASSDADIRALVEAARESAKAARENVDYARVVPDILTQILAKLDKLENKLDKIENAIKAGGTARRPGR